MNPPESSLNKFDDYFGFKAKLLFSLIIIAVTFFIYKDSLNNGFSIQDEITIINNPDIYSLKNINSIIKTQSFSNSIYRPVTVLTYILTYNFTKLEPFYFHLTNIILHALNSVLVFLILSLISPILYSILVPLFFILSPINTGTVSEISGRSELLYAFFGLISLELFVLYKTTEDDLLGFLQIFLINAFLLLSLLSKETALVFIILIFLIHVHTKSFFPE